MRQVPVTQTKSRRPASHSQYPSIHSALALGGSIPGRSESGGGGVFSIRSGLRSFRGREKCLMKRALHEWLHALPGIRPTPGVVRRAGAGSPVLREGVPEDRIEPGWTYLVRTPESTARSRSTMRGQTRLVERDPWDELPINNT